MSYGARIYQVLPQNGKALPVGPKWLLVTESLLNHVEQCPASTTDISWDSESFIRQYIFRKTLPIPVDVLMT